VRREETAQGDVFLLGMMIGAALGAVGALLCAPVRGREARAYLTDRAREGLDFASAATERGREVVGRSRDAMMQGRDVVSGALAEGRKAYREMKADEAV
jgi:gas vesicle protein